MNLIKSDVSQSIYHPFKEKQWTGVNWSKVEKTIENLQHRITKAMQRGEYRKVRDLQRLLNRSLSARLKAVRIVAQENSEKLPGIDGEVWTTSDRKHQVALELRKKSPTKPLRRISIPKFNLSSSKKATLLGKQQLFAQVRKARTSPLGIPCMEDRARQALWNMALLPCVEATSDPHSYGFRPYRGCWDAHAQIRTLLDKPTSPTWVLDANIEKCFDKTNHDWLLDNTPMETKVLKSWLKAGYLESSELFPTEEGTPQSGVISPTLANHTLNGLENYLKKLFKKKRVPCATGNQRSTYTIATKLNVVRYVDDFIVTGQSKRQLERVKTAINEFLNVRGLKISEEKTEIRPISQGFDFLGWTFRRYPKRLLSKISKKSISCHRKEIKYLTKTIHAPEALITKLNTKIRNWTNYHHCCNGIWKVWGNLNAYTYGRLMKWGLKRHSNKTQKWVLHRYWKHIKGRWTFFAVTRSDKTYTLMPYNLRQKRIGRRISETTNIFDLKNKERFVKCN